MNLSNPNRDSLKRAVSHLTPEKDEQIERLKKATGLGFRQLVYFLTDWLEQNPFPDEVYRAFELFDAKHNVRRPKRMPKGVDKL